MCEQMDVALAAEELKVLKVQMTERLFEVSGSNGHFGPVLTLNGVPGPLTPEYRWCKGCFILLPSAHKNRSA